MSHGAILITKTKTRTKIFQKLKLYKNNIDSWLNELKLELSNAKTEMNWNIFRSCYFSCNLFQARLTENKFRPASILHLLSIEVQMLHHYQSFRNLNSWPNPLYKCLCHHLPDVMPSLSSQLNIYIAEVLAGDTLSVNAFEFWHATGPMFLLRTISVRLHHRPMWKASFLSVGCSIMDDEDEFV